MQNFSHTASDVKLEEGGKRLTCLIKKADGKDRERQGITLDKIHNDDGNLQYREFTHPYCFRKIVGAN